MDYSPMDRIRHYLKLPINRNPCPQGGLLGGYPIVTEYIDLHSGTQTARVIEWGEFKQVGDSWRLVVEVEFQGNADQSQTKTIEFMVRNRVLAKSWVLK